MSRPLPLDRLMKRVWEALGVKPPKPGLRSGFLGRLGRIVANRSKAPRPARHREDRPLYRFRYVFADGSVDEARAPTAGDARAAIKRRRKIPGNGRLPPVVHKDRTLV